MQKKPQTQPKAENETLEENDYAEFVQDYVFKPSGRHTWRQQGPYLVCRECELNHAIWIGMEKTMVGETEAGEPILKDSKSLY